MKEVFGELRSRCHAPPSPVAWRRVCDAIDACPRETLSEQALPYVRSHVADWPAEHRVAPRRWLDRLARGEEVPELEVCEGAAMGRGHWRALARMPEGGWRPSSLELMRTLADPRSSSGAAGWARWEGLSRLRHLSIRDAAQADELMRGLRGNEALADLGSLTLTNVEVDPLDEGSLLSAPLARRLEVLRLRGLQDARGVVDELVAGAPRPGLRALALSGSATGGANMGWPGLGALADHAERWPGLEELEVRWALTGEDAPPEPPDMSAFAELEALDLGDNGQLNVAGWEALTRAGLPPRLERLDVSGAQLTLEALARTLEGTGVVSLNASYLPMSFEDMEELRVGGVLERLTELKLRTYGRLGSVGDALRVWVRADALALERLALGGAPLGEAGAKALARAPLGSLVRLEAPRVELGEVYEEFGEGEWPALRVLWLQANGLSGEAMEAWARRGWFAGLEELSWATNQVSARGLSAALEAWQGGRLRSLDLRQCGLGDEEAGLLAASPALSGLEELELGGNRGITQAGRAALAGSPWLPEHVRLEFEREAQGS
jgi:hypothetical protein